MELGKTKLIVDATVLFTALTGRGVTKDIIFSNVVTLYSPEYLFEEFEEHKPRIKELSALSSNELDILFEKLKSRITPVPKKQFERFLKEANKLVTDKDDTEYVALSLSMNKTAIWSNDTDFKEQSIVKVLTTSELVKYLKSSGHKF